jgi:hypothetical protein
MADLSGYPSANSLSRAGIPLEAKRTPMSDLRVKR